MTLFKMNLKQSIQIPLAMMGAFCISSIQAVWMDYDFAGFDNAEGALFTTNLKFQRINKTAYGMSGIVEILIDFSNDFEAEMLFFHSAKGNNQFVKMPYKVTKDDICKIVDGIYIQCEAAKNVAAASELPAPPEEGSLCDLYKKGKYNVHQFVLTHNVIPKFLQAGYYKAQFIATKKNSKNPKDISTFTVHVKLF